MPFAQRRFAPHPWSVILAIVVGACALVAGPGASRADVNLVFGVYASDKPSAMVEQTRPTIDIIARNMTAALGEPVKIKLEVLRDYQTGVEVLTSGKIDFARLGAASYVTAKDDAPAIELLASELNGEAKFFHGVICVRNDSPIRDVTELKGKTFAFGAEQSTMGRYVAQLFLARAGITATTLKSYQYLERHDRVAAAVAAGQFDAGALEETIFRKLVDGGLPLRPLASYRDVTKAWVARVGLPPRITSALRNALMDVHDPKALAALRFDGFAPSTDEDYAITRAAIKENWRFFQPPPS
jgi:phosphonate transport system substrate-binding protein